MDNAEVRGKEKKARQNNKIREQTRKRKEKNSGERREYERKIQ